MCGRPRRANRRPCASPTLRLACAGGGCFGARGPKAVHSANARLLPDFTPGATPATDSAPCSSRAHQPVVAPCIKRSKQPLFADRVPSDPPTRPTGDSVEQAGSARVKKSGTPSACPGPHGTDAPAVAAHPRPRLRPHRPGGGPVLPQRPTSTVARSHRTTASPSLRR